MATIKATQLQHQFVPSHASCALLTLSAPLVDQVSISGLTASVIVHAMKDSTTKT